MTTAPTQQANETKSGMWADSTLRPYLRNTYDLCRKYTSISCKSAGIRDINLNYFAAEVFEDGVALTSRTALLALKRHQHMVLTTKHAGISLLCKYIAMELSAGKVDDELGVLHEHLPVYIDLSQLDAVLFRPGTVVDQVITELNDHLVEWGRSSFLPRLAAGEAVVIFDGLDHLGDDKRKVASGWIQEVISSGSKLVVGTRDPARLNLGGIPTFEIAGQSMNRITLMATHCLSGTEKVSGFHKLVSQSQALQQMVAHPVKLTMALEVYAETSKIPESELDLAAEFMAIAMQTVKRTAPAKTGVPDYLQRSWLAMVGFNLHKRAVAGEPATASSTELIGWMQDILGDESRNLAEQNLTGFLDKTSIFSRSQHGLGFADKSIMTLAAAQHVERHVVTPSFVLSSNARTGISKAVIAGWARDPAWKEVLEGVKTFLARDRSKEWLDEFLGALDGSRANRPQHSDEVAP